jgi:hypothetical protein
MRSSSGDGMEKSLAVQMNRPSTDRSARRGNGRGNRRSARGRALPASAEAGIALEAGADLVDFVEHDDRVGRPHFLQRLHELARHGADVGAAMAFDLGLVAHAADREAVELAPQRLGDRLADRGFADAGRANQQQDRTGHFAAHGANGEEFDDAFLYIVEAIVVAIQNLACAFARSTLSCVSARPTAARSASPDSCG